MLFIWPREQEEQAPVFERVDSAIHWINHYPADKWYQNKLSYQWIVSSNG